MMLVSVAIMLLCVMFGGFMIKSCMGKKRFFKWNKTINNRC